MATAREQAQTNLGPIEKYVNYSGYEKERQLAQEAYNNALQTEKNKYDTLINTLNTDRQKLSKDFSSGRSTVSDYYDQQRLLSGTNRSRVLKGTGLGELGQVVNRMRVGNELSDVANIYYNGVDDVNAKLRAGELDYDISKRTAQNTLDAALADIGARQKESENDYAKQLAALAEQIQSRWDSNRNAQAELSLQKSSLAQQVKEYEAQIEQQFKENLKNVAGDPTAKKYLENYIKAIEMYLGQRPGGVSDAVNYLKSFGVYAPDNFNTYDTSYLDDLLKSYNLVEGGANYKPTENTSTTTTKKTSTNTKKSSSTSTKKSSTSTINSGIDMSWTDRYKKVG